MTTKKKITSGIYSTLLTVLTIVFLILLSSITYSVFGRALPFIPDIIVSFISLALTYTVIMLVVLYVHSDGGMIEQVKRKLNVKRFTVKEACKGILYSLAIWVTAMFASFVLARILSTHGNNANVTTTQLVNNHTPWVVVTAIVLPLCIAPLFEELIFRGVIGYLFKLDEGGSRITYIIVSALVFGLLHTQTTGSQLAMVSSFVLPTIGGLYFAFIYSKYKNIWYSYTAHVGYNLIVVIITLLIH